MAHKAECPRSKDPNATCNCGGKDDPPATRFCNDCDTEIGATEKTCPKCKADLALADEEDGVVSRSLKRMANRKKREKKLDDPPKTDDPPKKKHVFSSLAKMVNKGGK